MTTTDSILDAFRSVADAYLNRWRLIADEARRFGEMLTFFGGLMRLHDDPDWLYLRAEERGITRADVRSHHVTMGGVWIRTWNHRAIMIWPHPDLIDMHRTNGDWP